MECYTSYIIKDGITIEKFTERNIYLAEKKAKEYVSKNKIEDAQIWVEDTSDKYL